MEIMGHTPFFHLRGEVVRGSELRISFEASVAPLIERGYFFAPAFFCQKPPGPFGPGGSV